MMIWFIGFLFCWGVADWSWEKSGKGKTGFWDELHKTITLAVLWPMFLGAMFCEYLEENEKKDKKEDKEAK